MKRRCIRGARCVPTQETLTHLKIRWIRASGVSDIPVMGTSHAMLRANIVSVSYKVLGVYGTFVCFLNQIQLLFRLIKGRRLVV